MLTWYLVFGLAEITITILRRFCCCIVGHRFLVQTKENCFFQEQNLMSTHILLANNTHTRKDTENNFRISFPTLQDYLLLVTETDIQRKKRKKYEREKVINIDVEVYKHSSALKIFAAFICTKYTLFALYFHLHIPCVCGHLHTLLQK